jgi:hypothetical protein
MARTDYTGASRGTAPLDGGNSMGPAEWMMLMQIGTSTGRALAGSGGGQQTMTGFGVPGNLEGQDWYDQTLVDPRFMSTQASKGFGRVGTMLSRRAEQPFRLGEVTQQPPVLGGGAFGRGATYGVRPTDPAYYDPNTQLLSRGMDTGDPLPHFSKDLREARKDSHTGEPVASGQMQAAPGPPRDSPAAGMQQHPDMQQMDAGLKLLGVDRDPSSGQYVYNEGGFPGSQGLFMGMQGGWGSVPGSEQRPFGGPESQRVGSQPTAEGGARPQGADIRRRRSEWQSA